MFSKNGNRQKHTRNDEAHITFGENLRKIREKKGITQEDLAGLTNIDRSYIGFLERGLKSPGFEIIVILAKHLKVKTSELFDNI